MLEYPSKTDQKWHSPEVQAAVGAFSPAIIIPGFADRLVATVKPGAGGTAVLEYTTDEPEAVDADPSAVTWVSWAAGAVSIPTSQTALGAVSAVRIFALTAIGKLNVCGEKRVDWR